MGPINVIRSSFSVVMLVLLFFVLLIRTHGLVDKKATKETKYLFNNLRIAASRSKTMVAMDQSTTTGEFMRRFKCGPLNPKKVNGYNSDIRDVCKEGPGLYGFDLVEVLAEWKFKYPDQEAASRRNKRILRDHVQQIHRRGGVSTFHWHSNNPINDEIFDVGPFELWQMVPQSSCRKDVLRNQNNCGKHFQTLANKFKTLVSWFNSLLDDKGRPIPIIFRPFHEQNGNWFWWGAGHSDFEVWQTSYRDIWSWMVKYHQRKGKNNVLWATSPNAGGLSRESYLAHCPKLGQTDVLGVDYYGDFSKGSILEEIDLVVYIAEYYKKVPAVTEQGFNGGNRDEWPSDIWTGRVLGPILNNKGAGHRVAWSLMWFNEPNPGSCSGGRYWGPHKWHPNANDFRKICKRGDILMEGDYKFFRKPSEKLKINSDQPAGCNRPSSDACNGNNGRGFGPVSICYGGFSCAFVSEVSDCKCTIEGNPKAPNGIQYCKGNRGCGYGDTWECGGFLCAKTDETFSVVCVSYCPERTTCAASPNTCFDNGGRGFGDIVTCSSGNSKCAKTRDNCECKVSSEATSVNGGVPYCLSKGGCGWGDIWDCGAGFECAKTDNTYEVICISYCPGSSALQCGDSLATCEVNFGRGLDGVRNCDGSKCATDLLGCDCEIEGTPVAANGYPFCLSNLGCGYGDKWECGDGLTCAKTDQTFEVICVSQC